jgi:hypothetical protein
MGTLTQRKHWISVAVKRDAKKILCAKNGPSKQATLLENVFCENRMEPQQFPLNHVMEDVLQDFGRITTKFVARKVSLP